MLRGLIKIIILAILLALLYGLWLLYKEKTPEERKAIRETTATAVKDVSRTLGEAGKKVVEKGEEVIRGDEEDQDKND